MVSRLDLSPLSLSVLVALTSACAGGDTGDFSSSTFGTYGSGQTTTSPLDDDDDDESGDMGHDGASGDGDASTGDGDPSTGDGDPSTGDGDPSTGDGDPSTGDGDPGPVCGDGQVNGSEQCDGPNLGGQDCASLGYAGGTLACSPLCQFDTSGCSNQACGNGVIEGAEVCDGAALNGQTCASQGYAGGVLACNANCDGYNHAGCNDGNCCIVGGVGCEVPFVQNCVCNLDGWCCVFEWDSLCVNLAINSCSAQCG
jgi:hypothetical protein